MAQPGSSQALYRSIPAGGLPIQFGPSVDEHGANIRRLAEQLQEEARKPDVILADSGPDPVAVDERLILPSEAAPPPGPTARAPLGPSHPADAAEGVRAVLNARSAAARTGAAKSRNDAAFASDVASSYGAAGAERDARNARRQEARTTGLNTDPAEVAANARKATEQWKNTKPFDARKDFGERQDRAAVAQDTAAYSDAMAEWEKTDASLRDQYNAAIEDDTDGGKTAMSLMQQIEAHNKARPVATERMTGGLTPQEVMEPVAVTMAKLPDQAVLALARHFREAALTQQERLDMIAERGSITFTDEELRDGTVDEAITAAYADLEPEERLQVMANNAQRIMSAPPRPVADRPPFDPINGRGNPRELPDIDSAPGPINPQIGQPGMGGEARVRNEPGVRGTPQIQLPDGTTRTRAFSPDHMAPYINLDPFPERQGPDWVNEIYNAGLAMNMDPAGYANEGVYIGEVQRKLADYQKKLEKWDVKASATGGYYFTPKPDVLARQGLEGMRRSVLETARNRAMSPEDQARIKDAFEITPDELKAADGNYQKAVEQAKAEARSVMSDFYERAAFDRGRVSRDRRAQIGFSSRLNDPRYAPGMLMQSLDNAGTDPAAQALVWQQFGRPDVAARLLGVEATRQVALSDRELEGQRINALGKDKGMLPGDAVAAGTRSALDNAFDPELGPEVGLASYVATQSQADAAGGVKRSKDDYEASFAAMLVSRSPDVGFNMSVTQRVLEKLAKQASSLWRGAAGRAGVADTPRDYFLDQVGRTLGDDAAKRAAAWWDARHKS